MPWAPRLYGLDQVLVHRIRHVLLNDGMLRDLANSFSSSANDWCRRCSHPGHSRRHILVVIVHTIILYDRSACVQHTIERALDTPTRLIYKVDGLLSHAPRTR